MSVATENTSYVRQTAILDPEKAAELRIVIAGMGTVGSNTAAQAARAGFKHLHLIDMDIVEPHNLPSQAFDISQLNENKATAMAENLEEFAENLSLTVTDEELMGGEQFDADVLVSAVDSMNMRKLLFELSAVNSDKIKLFIDVRMGGNTMKMYAFDPHDKKRAAQYAKTLYSDKEAEPVECGGRTFAPVGALSGAFVTQMLTKYLRDNDHPPYYLEMDFDRFNIVTIGLPKIEEG